MTRWNLKDNSLFANEIEILRDAVDVIELVEDEKGHGVFLRTKAEMTGDEIPYRLGTMPLLQRFMACYRNVPTFMAVQAGTKLLQVHTESLCLLCELSEEMYVLMLPILDGFSRGALQGTTEDRLELMGMTGCSEMVTDTGVLLYLAFGDDPYALMQEGAVSIQNRMKTGNLRTEKVTPAYFNYLGWCTWDAFYFNVDEEKYFSVLEEYKQAGMPLKFTLLDDGWQQVSNTEQRGQGKLTSFEVDQKKFPGGLSQTVRRAKEEYGVEEFLVWHGVMGYWAGVDGASFPQYRTIPMPVHLPVAFGDRAKKDNEVFLHEPVAPECAFQFYDDFHTYLRREGVDGVKIDTQYIIESTAEQTGGRCEAMKVYHHALDASTALNFHGNFLNCMSCSNDMMYNILYSNATRSSGDFVPGDPRTDCSQLIANAYASYWMEPFTYPDWDMFWSKHPNATFHAMARVVGGSPLYVSDKFGNHDFDLLRQLCLADGTILRAKMPGRPTKDSLMVDPLKEKVLLKIFNYNTYGGILGTFHLQPEAGDISGTISPADVCGLNGERFVVFDYRAQKPTVCEFSDTIDVTLSAMGSNLYWITPIEMGVAVIGLVDKMNGAGAVTSLEVCCDGIHVQSRGEGRFWLWCETEPVALFLNGAAKEFHYDAETKILSCEL